MRRFAAMVPVLLVVLLVFASAAATQPTPKVSRVGMLCDPLCNVSFNNAFVDELRKLGWVEGTTIVIDRKDPDYRLDLLQALAADLVRSKPNLIVTFTPQAARAAKNATSDIPIVILFVADPVGAGLASSLAHPGGNVTGVATFVPGDFGGKFLEILREVLPQAKRVAVFINPSIEMHRRLFPETAAGAAKLGFQLDVIEVREAGEMPGAIAAAKARGAEALDIFGDPIFAFPPNRVPDLAAQAGLPSISVMSSFAQGGWIDFLRAGLSRHGATWGSLCRSNSERRQTGRASYSATHQIPACH
jgi:putative ABC transport system substrate-binding protein